MAERKARSFNLLYKSIVTGSFATSLNTSSNISINEDDCGRSIATLLCYDFPECSRKILLTFTVSCESSSKRYQRVSLLLSTLFLLSNPLLRLCNDFFMKFVLKIPANLVTSWKNSVLCDHENWFPAGTLVLVSMGFSATGFIFSYTGVTSATPKSALQATFSALQASQ
jgi:hypothetical protein